MITIKVTNGETTDIINAASITQKEFKGVHSWILERPVQMNDRELSSNADVHFGENSIVEIEGQSITGPASLFVNSDGMVMFKCYVPDEEPFHLDSFAMVGKSADLNNVSGSIGPFAYEVNVHLDTTDLSKSYFVVVLKLLGVKLVDAHLDVNHPSITFGGTVLGNGAKGTLGVDFNGGRIYVDAEVHTILGSKKYSFDLYHWGNYKVQNASSSSSNGMKFHSFAACSASPRSGWISIENEGGYVAKFDVSFTLNGERVTRDSGNFTLGVTKVIDIPADATDVVLHAWDAWFIKSWKEIFSKHFDGPVCKKYKLLGTTLGPDYKEL